VGGGGCYVKRLPGGLFDRDTRIKVQSDGQGAFDLPLGESLTPLGLLLGSPDLTDLSTMSLVD
jgi:hypothetical protein